MIKKVFAVAVMAGLMGCSYGTSTHSSSPKPQDKPTSKAPAQNAQVSSGPISQGSQSFLGEYLQRHIVTLDGTYQDKPSCEKDQYTWENGHCVFKNDGDDVFITSDQKNNLQMRVTVVGKDLAYCDFKAPALLVGANQIVGAALEEGASSL